MGLGDTAQLVAELELEDHISDVAAAIEERIHALSDTVGNAGDSIRVTAANAGDAIRHGLGDAVDTVGTRLETFGSRLHEVARLGSELGIIGRAVGGDLGNAAAGAGEFVRVAGDTGLAIRGISDLSHAAAGGLSEITTGSRAAAAATAKLGSVATAAGGEIGGAGVIASVGWASILGPLGIGTLVAVKLEEIAEGMDKQRNATRTLTDAQKAWGQALAEAAGFVNTTKTDIDVSTVATLSARDASDYLTDAQKRFQEVLREGSDFWHQYTTDAKETGAGLDVVATSAYAAARALVAVDIAKATPDPLGALALGPRRVPGLDLILPAETGSQVVSDQQKSIDVLIEYLKAKFQTVNDASKVTGTAIGDNISRAFDTAKTAGDRYFDAIHQKNDRAIADAEKLAKTQRDAAVAAADAAFEAAKAADAAPVNAAEAALRATQQAEQRRNLEESQAAAQAALQANQDPARAADLARTLRDATEALANFDAQVEINRLKAGQAEGDTSAQGIHDRAVKEANDRLAAAQDQAQRDQDTENARAQLVKQSFDDQLAALKQRDAGKPQAQVDADIRALQDRLGVDSSGRQLSLVEAFSTAIRQAKPADVHVANTFTFLLDGKEIRATLAGSTSVTNATSVRTGSTRP